MKQALDRSPEASDFVKRAAPLARIGKVEEVAGVIHFLCSPAASYVNDVGWVIESGVSLTMHL